MSRRRPMAQPERVSARYFLQPGAAGSRTGLLLIAILLVKPSGLLGKRVRLA